MAKDSGEPMAWIIAVLGVWVLVSPFVFGIAGTYQLSLVVSGVVVATLAAWRALMADDRVPLPFLPLAVIVFGLWTIASPFVLGSGFDLHGVTLVVAGLVFVVMPAMMINKLIDEQTKGRGMAG